MKKSHKVVKWAILVTAVVAIFWFLYELLSVEEYSLLNDLDDDDIDDDYFDCDDLFEN